MSPFTTLKSTFAIASFFLLGCRFIEDNRDHCGNNDGDTYCAALHADGARPYCEAGTKGCITPGHERDGCVAERPQDECYSPCGGSGTLAENGGCPSGSETTEGTATATSNTATSGTATTDPTGDGTTGPMPCTGARDCPDAAAPFCEPVTATCVACDGMEDPDGACAELDPMAPICLGGTCVQCTLENPAECDEQRWVCDGSTGSCVPCTEHAQCSSGACELDPNVGQCFPGAFVVHVDGDGGADYTSIVDAVADVPNSGYGVIVVHELDGGADYGPTIISGGKVIALLAAPGESPSIRSPLAPTLRATGAGTALYMDGLTVSGNPIGLGLRVDADALAWVDRSRIVENVAGGIRADGGAVLVLRSSFVGGEQSTDVLSAQDATVDVLYSTLGAGNGLSTAIYCNVGSIVTVRNSLLVSRDFCPEVICPGIAVSQTATEFDLGGMNNVALGDMEVTWFQNYGIGDFHLSILYPAAIGTVAAWTEGDPTTDIDGDARPTVDGASDHAGADVP